MSSSPYPTNGPPRRHDSHLITRTAVSTRFRRVQLTEERLDEFHGAATEALSLTVKQFVQLTGEKSIDMTQWRHMRSRNGVAVYYDRHQDASAQHSTLLVAGTVKACMADVMEGLYMDTTEDTRLVQHRIHPRFVDADVLSVVEQRSAEHPYNFTGLKWALLKSSNTGIVSNRDLCYLEKLGTIALADGRQLGYFIMQSVNLPECSPSQSTKVYGELWSSDALEDIVLSIGNAVDVAYAKRFTERVHANQERPESLPALFGMYEPCRCFLSFFDSRRQCAGCPKRVCKKCRVKREIFHREDYTSPKLASALFCFTCIESVRNSRPSPRESVDESTSPHHGRRQASADPIRTKNEVPRRVTGNSRRTGIRKNIPSRSVSSTTTTSEGDSWSEPESERSLGLFMRMVQNQLDEVKYDDMDVTSRVSELAMLGSGAIPRYIDADDDTDDHADADSDGSVGTMSYSCASSHFSICEGDANSLSGQVEMDDVESIKPMRRNLQPPEMLQAQKLDRDGSLLSPPKAAPPRVGSSEGNLMSRLERASRLAEQTHQFTKEQSRRHKLRMYTPSRLRSVKV